MRKPRICAAIVSNDAKAASQVAPLVDLFEVRIDLIGDGWQELSGQLGKPWIATNRNANEGGKWSGTEDGRIEQLLQAIELGASIIDVELETKNLGKIVSIFKKRAKCLLSYHNLEKTLPLAEMKAIVQRQLKAGADIAKIVTTAREARDNISVLQLFAEFPGVRLVSLAMGAPGIISRVLCPLAGGDFTYASIETGKESAQGQLTVKDLLAIYEAINKNGK
ncbi:MAG: type I 3-dehydroquinate dehydratase [Chloroflexi bacterium]|nr:type I 3-dehydroquinate dehydratase [Chloroflexota bacterium]